MSDLISRETVIDILKQTGIIQDNDIGHCVIEEINRIPTAYDIDKVVEELELIRAKKTCNKEKCDTKEICRICVVDDAIEIVKQGGVYDNVCEWKQTSTAVYRTSCGYKLEEYFETNGCYCKQCGKKIKVVEQWRD